MARAVFQSLAGQTRRLVSDLASPLVAGLTRLVALARQRTARVPRAVPMAAAGLLVATGVAAAVALHAFGPPAPATDGVSGEPLRAGPVKIVDAAPRAATCEEQVWPYIEQRCLRRAATPPQVAAAPTAEPSAPVPQPPPPAPVAADPAPSPPTAAMGDGPAQPPVQAVAHQDRVHPEPVQQDALQDNPQGGAQAAIVAGAAAGAAAAHLVKPERRAERRRSIRRSARRSGFRLPILGLRF